MFPTVLLAQVPLHRPTDTDCSPHRERGHAISVAAGYHYQNVLTPLVSKDIITKLGAEDITQVYSSQGIRLVHPAQGDSVDSHEGVVVYEVDAIQGPKVSIESVFDEKLYTICEAEIMVAR
jgi:hypothetical protein